MSKTTHQSPHSGSTIDKVIAYVDKTLPEALNQIQQGITDVNQRKADKNSVPGKTSQLENDSGYITNKDIETAVKEQVDEVIKDLDIDIKQVQADWEQTDETQPDYIKNKPEVFPTDDGVGQTYMIDGEPQGEIFGDYDNNKAISKNAAAFGSETLAGCRCYYYGDNVVFTDNDATITLQQVQERLATVPESFETGWEVGDVISMVNNSKYWNCATITAINGNIITVTKLPFTSIADMSGDMGHDDYAIFVFTRPEIGTGSVGASAFVAGIDNKGLAYASFTSGRQNENQAQYGFLAGRKNKLSGHAGFIAGQSNIVTADGAGTFGTNNKVSGARGLSMGNANTLTSYNSFVGGHNNKVSGHDTTVNGYSNTVASPRSAVFGVMNILDANSSVNLVGGGSNIIKNGKYNLLTGNSCHVTNGDNNACFGSDCHVTYANRCTVEGTGHTGRTDNAHIQGRYSLIDNDKKYAHILGNGTDFENRSNAHTIDWSGNAWYAGKIFIGGTNQDDGKQVATIDDINQVVAVGTEGDITPDEFISLLNPNAENPYKDANIVLLEDIVVNQEWFDENGSCVGYDINFKSLDLNSHTLSFDDMTAEYSFIDNYTETIKNGTLAGRIDGQLAVYLQIRNLCNVTVKSRCMFGDGVIDACTIETLFDSVGSVVVKNSTLLNGGYIERNSCITFINNTIMGTTYIESAATTTFINNKIECVGIATYDEEITSEMLQNKVFVGNQITTYETPEIQCVELVTNEQIDELKTKIIYLTDTTYEFDFANNFNNELRFGEMESISFTFGDGEYTDPYYSGIRFDSGETPTAIDYTDSGILNWVGTDCTTVDGLSIFQPSANTHYDIVFDFNGTQFIGLVNGYVPSVRNVVSE